MYLIGRTYTFSAAHTIQGHPRCGQMHGHNYKVLVKVRGNELDKNHMVLDFADLDKVVKPILEPMDHMYLAYIEDPKQIELHISEVFHLLAPASTAECLARYIYEAIVHTLVVEFNYDVEVTIWETDKSFATYLKREANYTATHGS